MDAIINESFAAFTLIGFAIGGAEFVVLLVILLLLLGFSIATVLIVLAIVRASQKSGGSPSPSGRSSTESRLKELDALRASGAITDSEYEEKRSLILDDL